MMNGRLYPVGHVQRTLFSTWRVEAQEARPVSMPFGAGFGCGATYKVTQGEKRTLQIQYKLAVQSSAKVTGPIELGLSATAEESFAIGYEFTCSHEWSYPSRPCEFCHPRVHFPGASVMVWSKRPVHLPFFVSRVTQFNPGEESEIRGNCRTDRERCPDCAEAASQSANPALTAAHVGGPAHIERVILAERSQTADLTGMISDFRAVAPEQSFFVGLDGKIGKLSDAGIVLLSVDEVDRSLGAVRLVPGRNRLLLLVKRPSWTPNMRATLMRTTWRIWDEHGESTEISGTATVIEGDEVTGLAVEELVIQAEQGPQNALRSWRLQISNGDVSREWPVAVFGQPTSSNKSHGERAARKKVTSSEESTKARHS
jgi:hypothetical protein